MPKDLSAQTHLPIGVVERETGLPKDTLRVWERRYGFPAPMRDALGGRLYSPADIERLRLIKRLIDQGHRPGKLIAARPETLRSLVRQSQAQHDESHCLALLKTIRQGMTDADALRSQLGQTLLQQGMVRFVCDTLAPLNRLVGEAWLRGELQVYEEHLYSQLVENLLRAAISASRPAAGAPRVLLTTVPEEQHGLGLLMVEAVLTEGGAVCVPLGTRTPLHDIRQAAEKGAFNIVALSFSAYCAPRIVTESLNTLRAWLPAAIELWAGGTGVLPAKNLSAGIRVFATIEEVLQGLNLWHTQHAT